MSATDEILRSIDVRLSSLEGKLGERCKTREARIAKLEKAVEKINNPVYVLGIILGVLQVVQYYLLKK